MKEPGNQSGNAAFLLKKSYEMAYALFRIAAKIGEKGFAENLGRQGTALLGAVALGKYDEAATAITAIEYFVKLGVDLNFISLTNGDLVFAELAGLEDALLESGNQSGNPAKVEEVDLSEVFSESGNPATEKLNPAIRQSGNGKAESGNPAIRQRDTRQQMQMEERHQRIIEKIRQSGNCRIKDLQDFLPDCSERTLRYDLQTLMEQGIIERRGGGGPGVFYRLRESSEPQATR